MTNGNDEAFARSGFYADVDTYDVGAGGLTKREYFAAMAMQGLAARNNLAYDLIPREAIEMADALIADLNESGLCPLCGKDSFRENVHSRCAAEEKARVDQ